VLGGLGGAQLLGELVDLLLQLVALLEREFVDYKTSMITD